MGCEDGGWIAASAAMTRRRGVRAGQWWPLVSVKVDGEMTDIAGGRLRQLVEGMRGQRLLVLGDMLADEQLVGRPTTVAREAPVLVLEEVERTILPGGATNVAANAAALGAAVGVCGVLGDDVMGELLRERLCAAGIDVSGLVVDAARPTTTKTRIWAGGVQQVQQLLLRVDRVIRQPVEGAVLEALFEPAGRGPAGGVGYAGRRGDVGLREWGHAPGGAGRGYRGGA